MDLLDRLRVVPMKKYPKATVHGEIEKLFEDVYWVHGSRHVVPGLAIDRNMVVVCVDDELVLINPVRLSKSVEKSLESMGKIACVIRLGDFHGLDDQYYCDRYKAEFWCQKGQATYTQPQPSRVLEPGTELPIPDSEIFLFSKAKYPEGAILLKRHCLLITTDAVQYLSDWSNTTWLAKFIMHILGFRLGLNIGKPWLKRVTADGDSLESDFRELLDMNFENLIAAHGAPLMGKAKILLKAKVNEIF